MRKGKIFPAAIDKSFSCDTAGQKKRNPHNMEIWEILLLIVGVWAAFEIVFSAIVFFAAFRRGKKRGLEGTGEAYMLFEPLYREEKQYADGLEKREVSVTARDGTTLKGDFYPAPNARATLLYFHGYRGTSADFCFCIRFSTRAASTSCCPTNARTAEAGENTFASASRSVSTVWTG